MERFDLRILALSVVKRGKIVQARSHAWMIGAEGVFSNRKRSLVERFRLGVLALVVVKLAEAIYGDCHVGMIGA